MNDQANRFVQEQIELRQQYIEVDFNSQLAESVRTVKRGSRRKHRWARTVTTRCCPRRSRSHSGRCFRILRRREHKRGCSNFITAFNSHRTIKSWWIWSTTSQTWSDPKLRLGRWRFELHRLSDPARRPTRFWTGCRWLGRLAEQCLGQEKISFIVNLSAVIVLGARTLQLRRK